MIGGPRLPRDFFARDVVEVARDLLGRVLWRDGVAVRITEVEAYRQGDSASHCRHGCTDRNAPMWGPPGHAYVYQCYGIHQMLNLVTAPAGTCAAVLIRSGEPAAGLETIRARRGDKRGPVLLTGPGKIGQALALDRSFSGHSLCDEGGLEVRRGSPVEAILVGPRVGIGYADPTDQQAPWRLAVAGTPWVSHPRDLEPAGRSG